MKYKFLVFILFFNTLNAQAAVQTKKIQYQSGGVTMNGYLAFDDSIKTKRPGILVVHEWWGHNDYAQKRARMLATLGYTAFALDMYGDGKTASHPDDAAKFSQQVFANLNVAEARFKKALEILKQQKTTDAGKIAAIGYCFGGGVVLEMARRGLDLDAVVSFHGSLGIKTIPKPGSVKAKILVLNGKADPFTTQQQITNFKKVMDNAKVDYEFVNYDNAKHSFTNPDANKYGKQFSLPLQYNKKADEASWNKMQQLFKTVFEK